MSDGHRQRIHWTRGGGRWRPTPPPLFPAPPPIFPPPLRLRLGPNVVHHRWRLVSRLRPQVGLLGWTPRTLCRPRRATVQKDMDANRKVNGSGQAPCTDFRCAIPVPPPLNKQWRRSERERVSNRNREPRTFAPRRDRNSGLPYRDTTVFHRTVGPAWGWGSRRRKGAGRWWRRALPPTGVGVRRRAGRSAYLPAAPVCLRVTPGLFSPWKAPRRSARACPKTHGKFVRF